MSKKDQNEAEKPVLSRRELLIRTGQVALVVGKANVFATLVSACGSDGDSTGPSGGKQRGSDGDSTGPNGGKQPCYSFTDNYNKQWADYYGYTGYCYETYQYDGYEYGTYNLQGGRMALSGAPRYQRGE